MSIPDDVRHSWDSIDFGCPCDPECYRHGQSDADDTFRLVAAVHKAVCPECKDSYSGECQDLEDLRSEL